ncbi:hypothetical protein [Roseimaritima multifibrata]|nr:hypothetical protein [Roseimaritima multifibrata]
MHPKIPTRSVSFDVALFKVIAVVNRPDFRTLADASNHSAFPAPF